MRRACSRSGAGFGNCTTSPICSPCRNPVRIPARFNEIPNANIVPRAGLDRHLFLARVCQSGRNSVSLTDATVTYRRQLLPPSFDPSRLAPRRAPEPAPVPGMLSLPVNGYHDVRGFDPEGTDGLSSSSASAITPRAAKCALARIFTRSCQWRECDGTADDGEAVPER